MPGKLLCFTPNEMALHNHIFKIIENKFGNFTIPYISHLPATNYIVGQPFDYIQRIIKQEIHSFISMSQSDIDAIYSISQKSTVKQISTAFLEQSRFAGMSVEFSKNKFYEDMLLKMNHFMAMSCHLGAAMSVEQTSLKKIDLDSYHLAIGYCLLLPSIIGYNMCIHYSNQQGMTDQRVRKKNITNILKRIKCWMESLETDHLPHITDPDFHALCASFFQYCHQFKREICLDSNFKDVFPEELYFPLPVQQLELYLKEKNQRASYLGAPYHAQIIYNPHSTQFGIPDSSAVDSLMDLIKKLSKETVSSRRMQILFYYNHEYGNVDLLDIHFNKEKNLIEIINVHAGINFTQHYFLKKLIENLNSISTPYQIAACQANILLDNMTPSTYAYALSSLVASVNFEDLLAQLIDQPYFFQLSEAKILPAEPINVLWFPFSALGNKTKLFMTNLVQMKQALGENKFNHYAHRFDLFEASTLTTKTEPQTQNTNVNSTAQRTNSYYLHYRRKRLAAQTEPQVDLPNHLENLEKQLCDLALSPQASISSTTSSTATNGQTNENERHDARVEEIKEELGATDNGQAMRRAAAGFCSMHDFRFLADVFTNSKELVSPLQAPDPKKGYTPLQQALKNGHATRAAYIIHTGHLTEMDFTTENADKMSAQKYYDEALPHSPIRRNTLLAQRLKK